MAKAFLSHSSKNKDLIEPIGRQLGRNKVHMDSLTFEAGEKTLEEIIKSLDETDIFVLFFSEPALESPWVKSEITFAKERLDNAVIERIYPIIIDKSITYDDPRIPEWIKKPYNIKYFDNEVLLFQKIRQLLRESELRKYAHLKELREIFVGRHDLLSNFERSIFTVENIIPTCIIAHSYFEGIGRRTFLQNALKRSNIVDKWYEPVYLPLSSRESIEDFIHKLNFVDKAPEVFKHNLSEEELDIKVKIARDQIHKFISNNEVIFVVDDGGIVLPNKNIVQWFVKVLEDSRFDNQVTICVISKFKPNPIFLRKFQRIVAFQVNELSNQDIQTLFVKYLQSLKVNITPEDTRFFLQQFHGNPGQVIYAAKLIASTGVHDAKMYSADIGKFDEIGVTSVLEYLKDDKLAIQILIALSKFEIISYDLVYRIFGETVEVNRSIQKLLDLGLFYNVSSTHEYLKLNGVLADYFSRSQVELDNKYSQSIRDVVKQSMAKPLELDENTDYSEFLINIENHIRQNLSIPPKLFLPSFILKAIDSEYRERRNYDTVITLAKRMIDAQDKFDNQIIREVRYFLCLAYCRTRNKTFFDEVQYFQNEYGTNNLDYFFLLGFYFRMAGDMEQAEKYFNEVLTIDPDHSRTKRELVLVYQGQGNYRKALSLAKDNYEKFRNRILHIQSYFTCLVKEPIITEADKAVLQELLEKTAKSLDRRSHEFLRVMKSEYEYYINGNVRMAIDGLNHALQLNSRDLFAFKALKVILLKENYNDAVAELNRTFPHFRTQ